MDPLVSFCPRKQWRILQGLLYKWLSLLKLFLFSLASEKPWSVCRTCQQILLVFFLCFSSCPVTLQRPEWIVGWVCHVVFVYCSIFLAYTQKKEIKFKKKNPHIYNCIDNYIFTIAWLLIIKNLIAKLKKEQIKEKVEHRERKWGLLILEIWIIPMRQFYLKVNYISVKWFLVFTNSYVLESVLRV